MSYTDYEMKVCELEEELSECRKHLAISVAKECKCKNIAEVNDNQIIRNKHLKAHAEAVFAENEKLRELLIEFIGVVKNNNGYHGKLNDEICDDEWCLGCIYANKPAIKQLLSKGGDDEFQKRNDE